MERPGIYLDNAAATRMDPAALDALVLCERVHYGNASSIHAAGLAAAKAVESARSLLARELNCRPDELLFTSGGTESNNTAIKGLSRANGGRGSRVVVSAIEHPSVLAAARALKAEGFEIVEIGVDKEGLVDPADIERAISRTTVLVSVMHANNETGVIQPVAEIGALCEKKGVLFHTDAAQSFLKTDLDTAKMNMAALTLSAHKVHGPKGVGALYLKKGVKLTPLLDGGGQENGLRSGTCNAAGISAFAAGAAASRGRYGEQVRGLRDFFADGLRALPGLTFNGTFRSRLLHQRQRLHTRRPG